MGGAEGEAGVDPVGRGALTDAALTRRAHALASDQAARRPSVRVRVRPCVRECARACVRAYCCTDSALQAQMEVPDGAARHGGR
jgi:hypothetical protein